VRAGYVDDGCTYEGTGQVIGKHIGKDVPAPDGSAPQYNGTGHSCNVCTSGSYLPHFLENNPMAAGCPWGELNSNNTNPYGGHMAPDTGVTRYFDWYIRRAVGSPDGVQKDMLLVNDQFPGPAIEANWGDWIEVTVRNEIVGPEEGTAIHWHGFLMTRTPEHDGVPGVTQCPIASGSSFTYRFQATLYGSSWWHSHYSAQYSGGAFGAMVVYGPSNVDYDIDVGSILLSDYYHRDYFSVVEQVMQVVPIVGGQPNIPAIIPLSDNNLINGMNDFDCSTITDGTPCTPNAPLAEFKFEPGKIHRLRLINAGSEGIQKFSIDGHELLVIANDFTEVVPYSTKIVTLAIGQRTDVIVQGLANGKGSYWMRSTMTSCAATTQPLAKAIVHYDESGFKPNTTAWEDNTDPCANDALELTQPWYPLTPTTEPEATVTITISAKINGTGNFVWTMDGSAFRANYNNPVLLLSNAGNNSYPFDPQWNVYNFGSNSSVRFIFLNKSPAPHPMHIHGHNMFILNEGVGQWDGTIINPENPQRRDTQQLVTGGFMVAQIDMDNPGVWPFHCHISWHVSGGLYINVVERPDDIAKFQFGQDVFDTCRDWAQFTNTQVPNQIDSGE